MVAVAQETSSPVRTRSRRLLLGLAPWLLLLGACETTRFPSSVAAPQASGPQAAVRIAPDARVPNDPAVAYGKLANGLAYYVRANGRPASRAELRLVVRAGSLLEDDDQLGLAHFVEHMAFNGTRHFARQELVDYLRSIGMRFGADVNASTGFEETVYSLQVPLDDPKVVEQGLQILVDWASGLTFEEHEVDQERGVVIEEWRSGRGAGARVRDLQLPVLFKGTRHAQRLPIGSPEALQSFSSERLEDFYRDWYRPGLMAVVAVGDFDRDQMVAAIGKRFSRLRGPRRPRPQLASPPALSAGTATSIVTDPELSQSSVQLVYRFAAERGDRVADIRRRLVERIAISLLDSRLGERLQEAEPPFLSASAQLSSLTPEIGLVRLIATVRDGESERGLEALLVELERARRHGFLESELERVRENLLRSLERGYQERDKTSSTSFVSEYIDNFLEGSGFPDVETELALARALLPELSPEELDRSLDRLVASDDRVVLATAPEKPGLAAPAEEALLALASGLGGRELEPWVDRVASEPLLAAKPTPGRIVERIRVESVAAEEWRLDNGIRVVLKPTDFKNDQVLFSAWSPGGTSLVSDHDLVAAETATSVLGLGGLGDHDLVRLQKLLTGKVAQVSPFIGELREGLSGGASSADLETLFEMIYLTFTSPRRDPEAFSNFVTRSAGLIRNRNARPQWVFQETISEAMSQGHVRRRPFDEQRLAEADLDASYRIYRDRFADASDFSFVFVGSFRVEDLEPLVATYLGGLPANFRAETWRDVGVRTPENGLERVVRRGREEQAQVVLIFTGPYQPDRQSRYDLAALSELLRERLRVRMREDLGGTYGVSVSASASREPIGTYQLSVSFQCDPSKVETLTAAALEVLGRIREQEPELAEVHEIQEAQRRSRETALRENGFWLSALQFAYDDGEDPAAILEYEQRVTGLTPAAIRRTAERVLDLDGVAKFFLLPESTGEGASAPEPPPGFPIEEPRE